MEELQENEKDGKREVRLAQTLIHTLIRASLSTFLFHSFSTFTLASLSNSHLLCLFIFSLQFVTPFSLYFFIYFLIPLVSTSSISCYSYQLYAFPFSDFSFKSSLSLLIYFLIQFSFILNQLKH